MILDDMLQRRGRMLYLDARNSIEIAPNVAKIRAYEMGKDDKSIEGQVS